MKNDETKPWTRREFTAASALAMLSGVVVTISGCSDGSSSSSPTTPTPAPAPAPAPAPPAGAADVDGVVAANHGHLATITGAMLTAGNALMLDITGNADHAHTVNLTADELGQIADGARVQTTSTNNAGHTHTVTFN